jgi:hypothetical protein
VVTGGGTEMAIAGAVTELTAGEEADATVLVADRAGIDRFSLVGVSLDELARLDRVDCTGGITAICTAGVLDIDCDRVAMAGVAVAGVAALDGVETVDMGAAIGTISPSAALAAGETTGGGTEI